MPAPTTWNAPSSGGTISGTSSSYHNVYHAGSYWFSIARTASTALTVRYASDPTGAWGTATLPAWPTGTTFITPVDSGGVQYDGTHYAFAVNVGGTAVARLYYATDPSGTWTDHDFGAASGGYEPNALLHDGSRWIMAGELASVSYPVPPFVGYTGAGSAVTSTWTFGTSTAATGYDVADLGVSGTRRWDIQALAFDGTNYVASASRSPASGIQGHLRYCTDITAASWSTPTTAQVEDTNELAWYADAGYMVEFGANPTMYHASNPTGTWTSLGTASTQLTNEALGLAYGNGYWVAAGRASGPTVGLSYLESTSPAGTYTLLTSAQHGFNVDSSSYFLYTVGYHGDYFVAGSNKDCELRWCYVAPVATGPTLLRQRQSPKRTPSRIRGVDLRQRQTPFVT